MSAEGRRRLYLWCAWGGALTLLIAVLAGLVPGGWVRVGYWAMVVFLIGCGALIALRLVVLSTIERAVYVVVALFWFTMMAIGLFSTSDAETAWISLSPTVIMGLNLQVVMAYLWFETTTTALWNALSMPVISSIVGGIYFGMHPGPGGVILSDFIRFEVSLLIAVAFVHILARSKDMLVSSRVEAARMRALAYRDSLTGLPNRRSALDDLLKRAAGPGRSTVMIMDVDEFKLVNDSLGHAMGDTVLITLAEILAAVSPVSVLSRWGGEEFLVIVDGPPERGLIGAEHLRAAVERGRFPGDIRVTVSIGLAHLRGLDGAAGVDDLVTTTLRLADLALYRAKRGGRNQVSVSDGDDDRQPV